VAQAQKTFGQVEGYIPQGNDDLVLVPLKRSDLHRLKAVKFSDAELARITKFQEWLASTVNPQTGQPFIPRNQFSALAQFCLNVAFRVMAQIAEEMARAEEEAR